MSSIESYEANQPDDEARWKFLEAHEEFHREVSENGPSNKQLYAVGKIPKVRFIHLRKHSPNNGIILSYGGCTIAYELVEPGVEYNLYRYALAFCNDIDNYCKHTGRAKSAGRLNSPRQSHTLAIDPNCSNKELAAALRSKVYEAKMEYEPNAALTLY